MNVNNLIINEKNIRKSVRRVSKNDTIADFYLAMSELENRSALLNRSECVRQCYRYWDIDHYKQQKIKDVKRITRCRDKFCLYCQNSDSRKRELKYSKVLHDLRKRFDIYHVVLTVPNCDGSSLISTLNTMYAKFPYLIQYLQGKRKANDLNFVKFGFQACIRALEVTHKENAGKIEYHPHFHCLFIFKKGLDKTKKHTNQYSFTYGKKDRLFSDNEIFLQKVWYLLYNGQILKKRAVDELKQGYSVIMDIPKDGCYHQVFKYVLGGNFKKGHPVFSYDVFKTLYEALYRRKMIQGYGLLNKFKFDEEVTDEEIDKIYEEIISELKIVEAPISECVKIEEVVAELDAGNEIKYISRNTIRRELSAQD